MIEKRFDKPAKPEVLGIDGLLSRAIITGQPIFTDLGGGVEKAPRPKHDHLARIGRILSRFSPSRLFR